jgi:hypothetical protein
MLKLHDNEIIDELYKWSANLEKMEKLENSEAVGVDY